MTKAQIKKIQKEIDELKIELRALQIRPCRGDQEIKQKEKEIEQLKSRIHSRVIERDRYVYTWWPKADETKKAAEKSDKDQKSSPTPSLGTIHGTVTALPSRSRGSLQDILDAREDSEKGEPIRNAKIFAKCKGVGKKKAKTDALGRYKLTGLKDGTWALRLKAKGYEDAESIVEISNGGTYEENF